MCFSSRKAALDWLHQYAPSVKAEILPMFKYKVLPNNTIRVCGCYKINFVSGE